MAAGSTTEAASELDALVAADTAAAAAEATDDQEAGEATGTCDIWPR